MAELARANEYRLELGRGPALQHSQRVAADHLEAELELHALRSLGQPAQPLESALRKRERLAERIERPGLPRGDEVELRARRKVARGLEQHGDARRDAVHAHAVTRHERFGDAAAERRASRRLQRRVQRVLIQHVHEAIVLRQREVGELALRAALHEDVHPLQHVEAILDVGRVHLGGFAHGRRVELVALNGRGQQQLAIGVAQLLDLPFDHAPHGLRQIAEHRPAGRQSGASGRALRRAGRNRGGTGPDPP